MANMSYCRFQNTLGDLGDCLCHMDDVDDLSSDEAKSRHRLIAMCVEIATDYGDELEGDE